METLHIPNHNERLERCYGRYSCRVSGSLSSQGRDSAVEEADQEIGDRAVSMLIDQESRAPRGLAVSE